MVEKKTLGILAIVFGGIGLLLSWIPFVNNFAFVLGLLSLILAVIGIIVNRKNKKLLALIGLILSIVAIVVVLVTQNAYSNAFNKAFNDSGSSAKKVSENSSKSSSSSSSETKTFKVGETAEYKGVQFKVNKVDYTNGDGDVDTPDSGKQYVVVNITITNNSNDKIDYNSYDYKLDDNGNQTDFDSYISTVDNTLNSGTLTKGANVTGNLVGEAATNDKLKLIYQGNMFSNAEHVVFELN